MRAPPSALDLDEVLATPVTGRTTGFPAEADTTVAGVGAQGWGAEDLVPPVVILRERALAHNLARMERYRAEHDVDLAPHGKTTMAPQLWARQLTAGATGITVATPAQLRIAIHVGVPTVVLANQLVDPRSIVWLAGRLAAGATSVSCWVDSLEGVELLAGAMRAAGSPRPLDVWVELGHAGGRTGCRDDGTATLVAEAAARAPELRLVGIAAYEGTLGHDRAPSVLDEVDRLCDRIAAVGERLAGAGAFGEMPFGVSAGGSIFFDRVVARLGPWSGAAGARVLLRAGCTLTHDHGLYARGSPFATAGDAADRFLPAFEAWGAVLSRPEPEIVVIGLGKRDVPFDVDPPVALHVRPARRSVDGLVVERLMDQHAICRAPADLPLAVGEVVAFGISHPCAAFDRRRVLPVLDDDDRVIEGVATSF